MFPFGSSTSKQKQQPPPRPQRPSEGLKDSSAAAPIPTSSSQHASSFPSINAVPTSETLGEDESLQVAPLARPYQVQTPTRYRRPLAAGTDSEVNFSNARRGDLTPLRSGSNQHQPYPTAHVTSTAAEKNPTVRRDGKPITQIPPSVNHNSKMNKIEKRKQKAKFKTKVKNDFQHPEDFPSVKVQWVNIAQRSAFDLNAPTSLKEWTRVAEDAIRTNPRKNMSKRLSPSYQHLQLIHEMQAMNAVRQMHFSPSTGIDSDFFCTSKNGIMELDEEYDEFYSFGQTANQNRDNDGEQINNIRRLQRSRRRHNRRDGRYRSINPVRTLMTALPKNMEAPKMSHKKYRLPARSDVGFPNASEEDIQMKQREINNESAWEEVSPRLVLAVTSDALGTLVLEPDTENNLSDRSALHLRFNGGGLEGMPFAGRDLLLAKERNNLYFKRARKQQLVIDSCATKALPKSIQPNPHSMLAPPIDASYSQSQGWRPRAFHDRQPGMKYFLACPLSVHLNRAVGSLPVETLLGSLTLYYLPRDGKAMSKGSGSLHGKISEEFWFPVGDWRGKVKLGSIAQVSNDDSEDSEDLDVDDELLTEWLDRKQKAIFSYDPNDTTLRNESHGVDDDRNELNAFFLIMQVYSCSPNQSTYLGDKEKGTKIPPLNPSAVNPKDHLSGVHYDSESSGTQIMTPLCFGVHELFPPGVGCESSPYKVSMEQEESNDDGVHWPSGSKTEFQLFPLLDEVASQENFTEYVCGAILKNKLVSYLHKSNDVNFVSSPAEDFSVTVQADMSHDLPGTSTPQPSQTTKKNRKLGGRLFRSSHKTSKSRALSPSRDQPPNSERVNDLLPREYTEGHAEVFVSALDSDFLQALLANPPVLARVSESEGTVRQQKKQLPKLLADVSGDFAVILDQNSQNNPAPRGGKEDFRFQHKRSHLLRLPKPIKPAAYAGLSEFREVLYLPIRPEKRYDVDIAPSYRSLLNLLYIYPRLLRKTNGNNINPEERENLMRCTIRIRVLRKETAVDGKTGNISLRTTPLDCFYNPAPWSGSSLLSSYYTKVKCAMFGHNSKTSEAGLGMRDEAKLNLPRVLDGCYSLEFSLFATNFSKNSFSSLNFISSTSIPLSSSSTRDSTSGTRVATVIPNGKHRLELGDFQLQFETRLISSVHVCDPSVATALRDFPLPKREYLISLDLTRGSSITSSTSELSSAGIEVAPSLLLASASDSSVVGQFPILLHMHLCSLVNRKEGRTIPSCSDDSLVEPILASVFTLCAKVRSKLSADASMILFKTYCCDLFDENFISSESSKWGPNADAAQLAFDSMQVDASASQEDEHADDHEEEGKDSGSVRAMKHKTKHKTPHDLRMSRIIAAMGATGIPLSRVAYGASKIDKMRIEAELYEDSGNFAHFFDDDETVATAPSLHNGMTKNRMDLVSDVHENLRSNAEKKISDHITVPDDNSIVGSASSGTRPLDDSVGSSTGADFAKRVKIAAQVMLAPCVGPSLSSILATGGASPRQSTTEPKIDSDDISLKAQPTFFPGSEAEESDEDDTRGQKQSTDYRLRGVFDYQPLSFSHQDNDSDMVQVSRGDHVYESIVVFWLKACVSSCDGDLSDSTTSFSLYRQFLMFPRSKNKCQDTKGGIHLNVNDFFMNMDFLLPLCLKSFILRCASRRPTESSSKSKVLLNEYHLQMFLNFTEVLAGGVMSRALYNFNINREKEQSLLLALSDSGHVIDFLVGLASVLHPEQIHVILEVYFKTLRNAETEDADGPFDEIRPKWTEERLLRVRCSRQLRLFALEKLSVLPAFLALNYPQKVSSDTKASTLRKTKWVNQYIDIDQSQEVGENRDATVVGEKYPAAGWLADLVICESLSICSSSCEAVVAEAIELSRQHSTLSQAGIAPRTETLRDDSLKREDLLMFQSIAIHAVDIVYELVVRRHSMDRRFQSESCRGRIAALFATSIFSKSLASVKWLARMEATHKVRSVWLSCFIFVLQEAPEQMIRDHIRSLHGMKQDVRFVRLLRLCSSTFQSFTSMQRQSGVATDLDKIFSPWLLQESFNTICAAINIVVEETVAYGSVYPDETKKLVHGILDVLLYVLTTPQSPVTQLRAVGGALQALEEFGVEVFLEITSGEFQNWLRVILSLMNSVSLSVRSIAVDFVVSLLGSAFGSNGNVDSILMIFLTVLPEVAAREIALYSVSGHVSTIQDTHKTLWPLRRSIADLEDANPLDDDRVDPQLAPILSVFCRACQAVVDGVLVEMNLRGEIINVVGKEVDCNKPPGALFDADEESLFEAANYFQAETAPMQKIRWLLTLKMLHESKEQWVETAETLFMCAHAIADAIPHLKYVWRPTRFQLWSDSRRSLWLDSVGEEVGHPERCNVEVMDFANAFLEPDNFLGIKWDLTITGKLQQPTVSKMCKLLAIVVKEAIRFYLLEDAMDELAYTRLEELLKVLMVVVDEHHAQNGGRVSLRAVGISARARYVEEQASLRELVASISGNMTRLAEQLLIIVKSDSNAASHSSSIGSKGVTRKETMSPTCYVIMCLSGTKPPRFDDSTTLPTFLEWEKPCICRVPKAVIDKISKVNADYSERICHDFAEIYVEALRNDCGGTEVMIRTDPSVAMKKDATVVDVFQADIAAADSSGVHKMACLRSKHFVRKADTILIEDTVAHDFPCALSRQRSLMTTKIYSSRTATRK